MVEPPGDVLELLGDCAAIIDKLDGSVSSETVTQTVSLRPLVTAILNELAKHAN